MDLGECIKVHDLALRADYEIASKEQEYFFELDVSATQYSHFESSGSYRKQNCHGDVNP